MCAGTFDAVVSHFVVNRVSEPRSSVPELARVAAPGARVVVTIWPSGQNIQSRPWAEVIEESGAVPVPGPRLPGHVDFARTRTASPGCSSGQVCTTCGRGRSTGSTVAELRFGTAAILAAGARR